MNEPDPCAPVDTGGADPSSGVSWRLTRRAAVAGTAWAVPVVAVSGAAPAFAVSGPRLAFTPSSLGVAGGEATSTITLELTGVDPVGKEVTITLPTGYTFATVAGSSEAAGVGQQVGTFPVDSGGRVVFTVTPPADVGTVSVPVGGVLQGSPAVTAEMTLWPYVVFAWGWNNGFGQIKPTTGSVLTPMLMTDLPTPGVSYLGTAYSALLYADDAGALWARGYNGTGAIGTGAVTNKIPAQCLFDDARTVQVGTDPTRGGRVVSLSRGVEQETSIAVMADGTVYASGINETNGLGPGAATTYWRRVDEHLRKEITPGTPVVGELPVDTMLSVSEEKVTYAETSPWGTSLYLTDRKRLFITGTAYYGLTAQGVTALATRHVGVEARTGPDSAPLRDIVSASIGWHVTAAVTADGKLWVSSTDTAEGGSGVAYMTETPLEGGRSASFVVYHERTMYVVADDNTCWVKGLNPYGKAGTGESANPGASWKQVLLPGHDGSGGGPTAILQIAATNGSAGFLLADGTVWVTGWNNRGQHGNGTRTGDPAEDELPVGPEAGVWNHSETDGVPPSEPVPAAASADVPGKVLLPDGVVIKHISSTELGTYYASTV